MDRNEASGVAHFSLSQARLALSCPLSWYYRYKSGMEAPAAGQAASDGSDLDELLNEWFGDGEVLGGAGASDEVWADYQRILDIHPIHPGQGIPQVEILIQVEGVDLPVLGYADLVTNMSVWEHKRGGGWDDAWWDAARRQVALYANALGKEWGGIIQVKDRRVHIEQFEISPELVQSVHDELRAGWDAIKIMAQSGETIYLPAMAKPGKACAWCDYEPVCPESVFSRYNGDSHE